MELVQRNDGTLGVKLPDKIRLVFKRQIPLAYQRKDGTPGEDCFHEICEEGFCWRQIGNLSKTVLFEGVVS